MDGLVIRIGMIGFNPGNGHPFSFSAIVNGYDDRAMRAAGWGVIADYLAPRRAEEFGIPGVSVTHVWAPDPEIAEQIRTAGRIPHRVEDPEELLERVDAVMIARDDWSQHERLALPFLEAGLPTFVDKPLTLDEEALQRLRPYLERGLLASWSGLRFAPELDDLKAEGHPPVLLRGTGPLDWDTYAVHVLEPALLLSRRAPLAVLPIPAGHASVAIEMDGGSLVQIDVLGDLPVPFLVECVTARGVCRMELRDRFTAFKRAVASFVSMVESGEPAVPPEDTLAVMRTLIAGRRALRSRERTVVAGEGA